MKIFILILLCGTAMAQKKDSTGNLCPNVGSCIVKGISQDVTRDSAASKCGDDPCDALYRYSYYPYSETTNCKINDQGLITVCWEGPPAKKDKASVPSLEARIAALEKRIADLEARTFGRAEFTTDRSSH
jgi:hypothetical protein